MSQHDYVINNDSGASVRADINSALQAILSTNSGTSAPTSTSAGTLWLDTTGGAPYALKIRDAGNNHWLTIASVTDPGSDGNLELLPGKINLPSSGGIYESDGSTAILTESSGSVTLDNVSFGSSVTFSTIDSAVATTSGTSVTLTNSVPSNANRVTVLIKNGSLANVDDTVLQLGIGSSGSPSYKTSGYSARGGYTGPATSIEASDNGFIVMNNVGNSGDVNIVVDLTYYGSNTWFCVTNGVFMDEPAYVFLGGGYVTLSDTLTQLRLITDGGQSFDAGEAKVRYFY